MSKPCCDGKDLCDACFDEVKANLAKLISALPNPWIAKPREDESV